MLKKLLKSPKLISVMAAMVAMFAIIPIASGGGSWTGIDPVFLVKDHKFNVIIKWPEPYTCSIEDPISVKIRVPKDSSYVFISESSDDVGDCGSPQRTITKAKFVNADNEVKVKARLKSEFDFPFMVEVYLDGELISTQTGDSNKWTKNAEVKFDDDEQKGRGR